MLAIALPATLGAPVAQVAGGGDDSAASFGPDSQVPAQPQHTSGPDYPVVVGENGYFTATYHGPYTGSATTTGAVNGPSTLAASIPALPPNPTATYYNAQGVPQKPFPAPYTPAGGLGTNGTLPRYMVESDFDFESIALGLYQEVSKQVIVLRKLTDKRSGLSSTSSRMALLGFPTKTSLQLVLGVKPDL